MKVCDYLDAKYATRRATTMLFAEARALGIPYPMPNGWLRTYGQQEITADAAERLRRALSKINTDLARRGLRVLDDAWLTLRRTPAANADDFLASKAWKRARIRALTRHGSRCQACGTTPQDGARLNVDHIKPRRLFPALALDDDNLQVLCGDCNEGKGNWDMTDFRPREAVP